MLFKPLLLIVLSVSGVLSQRGWGVTYTPVRICALKGSSVDLRCSYSYPTSYWVQKTFWFIYDWNSKQEGEPEDLSQNAEYTHRVKYLGNKNKVSNFRINQLKESDSAIYRFRFLTYSQDGKYTGLPGVSLTVTGLQVKVTENEAQSVTLTCSTICTLSGSPTFTWYKNGIAVSHEYQYSHESHEYSLNLASTDDTDLYSCATGGVTSPAVNVKCVKVEINSDTVSGGETVELTCRATCTWLGNSFIWYKNEQRLTGDYSYSQSYRNLTFTARSEDTGRFSCAVRGNQHLVSPALTLSVRCVNVEIKSSTVSEGESVTLTCKITCTDLTGSQTFIWYKNGQYRFHTTQNYQNHDLQFKARSGHAGSYSCAVTGHENLPSPAVTLSVRYPPKSVSVSANPSGEIVEGSSVTLTCSSTANPPVQNYTWFKNRAQLSWRGSSYTIKSITLQDAGEYYCAAENRIGIKRSPSKRLDVQYPPKNVSVSVSPSGEIAEGSSVTLTCSSDANPPVQNYTWYKINRAVSSETGGPEDSYTIKNITLQDAGEYYCAAENVIGRKRSPPKHLDVQSALQVTVQGGQLLIVAAAVGVPAILALVFLGVVCVRRRKSRNETEGGRQGNKSPIFGNVSGMAMSHTGTQDMDRDDGEVPLYSSVQPANTRNQEQVLYSTVQKPLPQCEEGVQYASIQFRPTSAAPRSPAPSIKEDCVLYSTLRKLDM